MDSYINFCKKKAIHVVKTKEKPPIEVIKDMFLEIKKHPEIKKHHKFELLDHSLLNNSYVFTKEEALEFIVGF